MDAYLRETEYEQVQTLEVFDVEGHNRFWNGEEQSSYIKIYHQNICSLKKNLDEFKILLNQLNCEYDCIIFTETFRIPDTSLFQLSGYNMVYNDGDHNKNDGVVVYIKNELSYVYETLYIGYCKALKIKLTLDDSKKIILTCIYRTPSGNEDMFVNDLGLYLNQTKQDAYSQILVGDMNIKINTNSNVVHDYLNLLSEHNYVSMINQLTRIHGVTGSCIDHIFLKCDKYNMHHDCLSMVFENHITDHRATILGLPILLKNRKSDNSLRNIHYLNYKGLKRDLTSYDWSSFYNETNVEILTETFINQLKKLISKNTFTKKISRASIKRKQWITSGIVKSVNEKNRLHVAYKLDSENEEKKLFTITIKYV
nr:unnamed protein product [Callosobruchus analis]